ncbi:MAG: helix-turn-helix domain-containing protein, partial [Pseudomonadota bacterium]
MPPRSAGPSTRSDIPKREGILDAATRVFLARGFEDTSMDLVAREASVA